MSKIFSTQTYFGIFHSGKSYLPVILLDDALFVTKYRYFYEKVQRKIRFKTSEIHDYLSKLGIFKNKSEDLLPKIYSFTNLEIRPPPQW